MLASVLSGAFLLQIGGMSSNGALSFSVAQVWEKKFSVLKTNTHWSHVRWPTHIDLNFDSTHNNKVKELLHEVVSKLEVIIGNCYWTDTKLIYKIQGCAWRASGDGQKPSDPSSRLPEQVSSTDHPSVCLSLFLSCWSCCLLLFSVWRYPNC